MLIYKITNLRNGKIYIGKTTKTLQKRWGVHVCHSKTGGSRSSYIQNAIAKHGKANFKIEEIDTACSPEELKEKEIFHIKSNKSFDPKIGYNLIIDSVGGQGAEYLSDITRSKMSIASHNRFRKNGGSGVCYSNGDDKHKKRPWITRISYHKKTFSKRFESEDEARKAYDRLSLFLYKSEAVINYDNLRDTYLKENLQDYFNWFSSKRAKTSLYHGVRFDKKSNKWMSRANNMGSRIYLGCYDCEKEAAEIVDKISLFLDKDTTRLNFPENKIQYLDLDLFAIYSSFKNSNKQTSRKTTSKFRGVSKHGRSNSLWCWEFKFNKARFRGTCLTEADAAKQYDSKASSMLGDKARLNFRK